MKKSRKGNFCLQRASRSKFLRSGIIQKKAAAINMTVPETRDYSGNPTLSIICKWTVWAVFNILLCVFPFVTSPVAPPFLIFFYLLLTHLSFTKILQMTNRNWEHLFHQVCLMLSFGLSLAALFAFPFYPVGIILTFDFLVDCVIKIRHS